MYTAATVTALVFLLGHPRGSRQLDLGKTTKKRSRSVDGLLWGGEILFLTFRFLAARTIGSGRRVTTSAEQSRVELDVPFQSVPSPVPPSPSLSLFPSLSPSFLSSCFQQASLARQTAFPCLVKATLHSRLHVVTGWDGCSLGLNLKCAVHHSRSRLLLPYTYVNTSTNFLHRFGSKAERIRLEARGSQVRKELRLFDFNSSNLIGIRPCYELSPVATLCLWAILQSSDPPPLFSAPQSSTCRCSSSAVQCLPLPVVPLSSSSSFQPRWNVCLTSVAGISR